MRNWQPGSKAQDIHIDRSRYHRSNVHGLSTNALSFLEFVACARKHSTMRDEQDQGHLVHVGRMRDHCSSKIFEFVEQMFCGTKTPRDIFINMQSTMQSAAMRPAFPS